MYSSPNSNKSTYSGGGIGIASRVRNRHSSLSEQMRNGGAATPHGGDGHLLRQDQQSRRDRDQQAGGGSLASTHNGTNYPPIRRGSKDQLASTGHRDSPMLRKEGLLTQASPTKGGVKSMLTQLPEINQPTRKQQDTINHDVQLIAWRRQPKNLSPAAGLKLPAMLPGPLPTKKNKVLLCLDIDETLVHASFTPAKPYNVKITIDVDGERGDIYVAYRPHVQEFLHAVGQMFEIAIFTASQSCYANPLMDALDPEGVLGRNRMFRQHCTEVNGARVKDMSLLGRSLDRVCLLDNSPVAYLFQPRNAIPIVSWFDDPNDTELLKLIPLLQDLATASTVYDVLDPHNCRGAN